MPRVDIIVAVKDEEESIAAFVERVDAIPTPDEISLHMLFVEDSSRDGTRPLLRKLAAERPDIGYWMLERGFGQCMALSFGLSRTRASAAIVMDVDGSHPTEAISELLSGFLQGANIVQCVRRSLVDRPAWRDAGTVAFHWLLRVGGGVDLRQQSIYYRLMSRAAIDLYLTTPRHWRYVRFPRLPAHGAWLEVPVDTRDRVLGESKYGPLRLVSLAVDGLLSTVGSQRMAAYGVVAVAGIVASLALGAWSVALALAALVLSVALRNAGLRSGAQLARMHASESANTGESG